jgi:H+/Cl- antiporter ClcA
MAILNIITFLFFAFLGYIIGRFGDYYLNFWMKDPSWAPHHWIYGLILIAFGTFYLGNNLGLWAISFGAGLFISDLKDFLELKVIGSDNKIKSQRHFWHID